MRVTFDDLLSIDDLDKTTREAVYEAIRAYAATGKGGTVIGRAHGSYEYDIIVESGYEIEFRIYRTDPKRPTMFVYLVEPTEDETAYVGDD